MFSPRDLRGNTGRLEGDFKYASKSGPLFIARSSAVFGDRGGAEEGSGETPDKRQRENETREGSNNREQLLSSAPLMSAANSCFGVLMTDGRFLLWIV